MKQTILISNILDQKASFKEHEFYINDVNITLDNIRPRFDSQLFYNCNLPWRWWLDYNANATNAVKNTFREAPQPHG